MKKHSSRFNLNPLALATLLAVSSLSSAVLAQRAEEPVPKAAPAAGRPQGHLGGSAPLALPLLLSVAPNAVLAAAERFVPPGKRSETEQRTLTTPSTTAHSKPRSKHRETETGGASASHQPSAHSSPEDGVPAPDRPSGPGA